MAHSHYVMDLFYREENNPERFRREVLRIEAADDTAAEAEGHRASGWRKPAYFIVRSIQTSAKSRERQIFDSRGDQTVVENVPEAATAAQPTELTT